MLNITKLAVISTLVASLVTTGSLSGAMGVSTQAGVGCSQPVTKITNIKAAPSITRSPSGPNWETSGVGPGLLTLSKSVTVSNSTTGAGAIESGVLNASLGFDSTKQYTTATAYQFTVPAQQTWVLRADAVYTVKTFHWTITQGCSWGGQNSSGNGTSYKFLRLQYRTYRIA